MTEESKPTVLANDSIENRGTLVVQLLYDEEPTLEKEALTAELQRIDPLIGSFDGDICLFRNAKYCAEDSAENPTGIVTVLPLTKFDRDLLRPSLQQTFDWPQAEFEIASCHHGLVVADIIGSALSAKYRLTNIQTVLAGVLKKYPPKAVHWLSSQRLIEPSKMLLEFGDHGLSSIFAGAVNVRSFRDQSDLSSHIFDTLGLSYFGLLDFQCNFRSLEPAEVAAKLFNLAAYVYEKGNIIENGGAVAGIGGEEWNCSLEWALVAPERPVVNLRPGELAMPRKS